MDQTLSANPIPGFLNQLYLHNKSMKQPDFLYVITNLRKLKVDGNFWLGVVIKWVRPVRSWDSKIDSI